jgi:pentatricopeptide repeat protein
MLNHRYPKEVVQSVGITPHEANVTISNPPSPLVWTCQKKKKKKMFVRMRKRELGTWTVMIGAYADCGNANESLVLFDQVREEGVVRCSCLALALLVLYR